MGTLKKCTNFGYIRILIKFILVYVIRGSLLHG